MNCCLQLCRHLLWYSRARLINILLISLRSLPQGPRRKVWKPSVFMYYGLTTSHSTQSIQLDNSCACTKALLQNKSFWNFPRSRKSSGVMNSGPTATMLPRSENKETGTSPSNISKSRGNTMWERSSYGKLKNIPSVMSPQHTLRSLSRGCWLWILYILV